MTEVMDNTVEVTQPESVQDDAVQAQEPNALEQFMADTEPETEGINTEETAAEEQTEQVQTQTEPEQPQELPKGIKGRILAAETKADRSGYERGRKEAEAEYQAKIADYEARLAKLNEIELTQEARELAQKEHISLEFAKRVIRAEKGVKPEEPKQEEQPQQKLNIDENLLRSQYENIKSTYGIDLLAQGVLTEDELKAIAEGRSDFNAAALKRIAQQPQQPKQTPPPVKASNPKPPQAYDFMSMTDEEFDRFNEKIGKGHPFKPR